jgi:response regulator NasT
LHDRTEFVKILVADRDGNRAAALAAQLQAQDDAFSISLTLGDEILLEAVRRTAPDIVIVDMARADRDGLESVRALSMKPALPVIMFVDDEDPAFMEEAIAAGVSSYHVTGADLPAIKPILRTATAFFKRTQDLQHRLAEAEELIATRQTIDTAKRLLMTRDGMSEPTAHRFLQRRAMDKQKKLAEIAAQLLHDHNAKGHPDE